MREDREMRSVYCEQLIKLGRKNKSIFVIEADLMGSSGTTEFKNKYQKRFIDVGIAEANMVGIAAGLAACGKKPFCTTFTPFITRRCLDQIEISCCYTGLDVTFVGTDPGIMATANGGTHMSIDDVGIMRGIPGMVVFEPVDSVMLEKAMPAVVEYDKPLYMRLFRKKAESVFDNKSIKNFDLFKGIDLRIGTDVTIIASGIMVSKALRAAEELDKKDIQAGVVSIHTIKPIDRDIIIAAAKRSGALVVAENHNKFNGLSSAVSEVVVENCPVPVKTVAIQDRFGEVGDEPYLTEVMNLTEKDIIKAAQEVVKLK